MKKEFLAGLITVLLVLSSALVLYVFVARTTSAQKVTQFTDMVRILGERVDSLERQRDLLTESAATLEGEAVGLRKRVRQIDAEIEIMRNVLGSAGDGRGHAAFSWRRLRISTVSGLVIIAFLALIWMLYSSSRREDAPGDSPSPLEVAEAQDEESEPVPGSVLEEEFPASAEEEPQESSPADRAAESETAAEPSGEEGTDEEKNA